MAVGDVFHAQWQIETADGHATVNWHYQEVTPSDSGLGETGALANALQDGTPCDEFADLLSEDVALTGMLVRKLSGLADPPSLNTVRKEGTIVGPGLPNNNGLRVSLLQSVFPSNRNGLFWIPGIAESQVTGNNFATAFMTGAVATFHAAIGQLLIETPNTGQWRLGVLSKKHLADNPGDFAGAFADAIGATSPPIVGSQRSRTTHRRGNPGLVV